LTRLRRGERLVLATHNEGKRREFATLLEPYGIELTTAAALRLPEPEETGATFAENASLKAIAAACASGLPALADDSGLAVLGLGGAPGIYSARWAGRDRDFTAAMRRVRDEIVAVYGTFAAADRRAAFIACLCLAWPDGSAKVYEGRVEGEVLAEPRGDYGFGYDPIFLPSGEARTFGEMAPQEKQRLSHRARAFTAFAADALPGTPAPACNPGNQPP
jgi:XTP/dITP diphosphohydrolase